MRVFSSKYARWFENARVQKDLRALKQKYVRSAESTQKAGGK